MACCFIGGRAWKHLTAGCPPAPPRPGRRAGRQRARWPLSTTPLGSGSCPMSRRPSASRSRGFASRARPGRSCPAWRPGWCRPGTCGSGTPAPRASASRLTPRSTRCGPRASPGSSPRRSRPAPSPGLGLTGLSPAPVTGDGHGHAARARREGRCRETLVERFLQRLGPDLRRAMAMSPSRRIVRGRPGACGGTTACWSPASLPAAATTPSSQGRRGGQLPG